MKRAAVILGAGASYDIHNGTVPFIQEGLRPPLARELFQPRFWFYAQHYPGAQLLGAELGRLAQLESAFDLEQRLTEYAESHDLRTQRAFKQIPPYLRDVLVAASYQYVPSPTNYLNLVRRFADSLSTSTLETLKTFWQDEGPRPKARASLVADSRVTSRPRRRSRCRRGRLVSSLVAGCGPCPCPTSRS